MSSEIRPKILVVDDEASIREFLQIMLKRERMVVEVAENGQVAWEKLQTQSFDLVISDIQMPEMTGIELLQKIKSRDQESLVLMITAFGTTDVAVQAMKLGAYDFLTKPFKLDDVKLRIQNALEKRTLVLDNVRLRKELGARYSYSNIIGGAKPMLEVFELIKRVAPTNSNILVTGESGTGKELVAKAIHYNSERRDAPFISVNCGAIPEELIESEMFGHIKGSFTGAIRDKKGYFESADGGTLFLDEIGELPLSMQATLLRALSDGTFIPVGSAETLKSNVRIVAATNRNLEDEVREQNFREDLYFRLNVINIKLPSLRERRDDVPMLLDFFVEKFSKSFGKEITAIPTETVKLLSAYNWPGNVRELENVVERMMALESSGSLSVEGIPEHIREPMKPRFESLGEYLKWDKSGVELEEVLAKVEREYLLKAIEDAGGTRKKAAKLLGVTMRSLRYRLEKFGLAVGDE
jgi:two-component system, NtrC family, response regulator PilR